MRYLELKALFEQWKGKVCFFGAGLIGSTWAYDLLKEMGFHIDFYCDNNKKEDVVIRDGIKTISLKTLYSFGNNVLVFITASDKWQTSIREQLEDNGIWHTVCVDQLFLQTFIEDLLNIDNDELNGRFKCILDDKEYISRQFEYYLGYRPDLDNPRTFNEKLQWLKLNDRNPQYTQLVDKYEVKKYIADKIGKEYAIPTLGVYNSFDEIDFDKLPRKFVLKCTHDSGSVVICRDKAELDKSMAKKILERGLRRNYYWTGREWPYKNVKPRIIAEQYLEGIDIEDLIDYKFLCMNDIMKMVFTCTNRFDANGLCVNFYDRYWNPMPFERHYPRRKKELEKPKKFEEMVSLSEKLSKGICFVRVDFYSVEGKIYVGEMTFYPGNGMEEFTPTEWDYKLGEMIQL